MPGFWRWALTTNYLLAMAPKPVLVLAVKYDYFRSGERAKLWRGAVSGNQKTTPAETPETPARHYTPAMAEAAAAFFSRHFSPAPEEDRPHPAHPAERLWCTNPAR